MNWHIIVAMAAPATPILKYTTKRISKKIFMKQLTIKTYRGLFESPTARKIPAPMLYTKLNTIPIKNMRRYVTEESTISGAVSMRITMLLEKV